MPFLSDYPVPEYMLVDSTSASSIATGIQQFPARYATGDLLALQEVARETNSYERFCADIASCFHELLCSSDTGG
jgi:hypothetical protein